MPASDAHVEPGQCRDDAGWAQYGATVSDIWDTYDAGN